MKKRKSSDIQLVITVALKKEVPGKWLESCNVPVHTLSALKSGALSRMNDSSRGMLVVITGAGLRASEYAALWIRDNLAPLYIVNIGTCGLTDRKRRLAGWIKPMAVSGQKNNAIKLDTRLPFPGPERITGIRSLISVKEPKFDVPGTLLKKHDAVDMECYLQALIFDKTDISFHCLKFSTDYSDVNTISDFNRNIELFHEAFKKLFSFISEDRPAITAVVPVYNREQTIRHAVDSILCQTHLPDEIIVVDDCSTDGTRQILDSYGDRITRVFLPKNAGPSKARNEGVRHARSEWIAFMDSDDCWEKDKIVGQIKYLNKYPFYRILQSEEKWIRNRVRVNPCKHHKKPEGWIFGPSLHRCLVSPSGVLLKKSLLKEYGGFDVNLPVCEDYDLWLKISRHYPVGLEPSQSVVKYGGHKDQLSREYAAMDSFRVRSLIELLGRESHPYFKDKISHVLKKKLEILIKGYEKRHKTADARKCREILKSLV